MRKIKILILGIISAAGLLFLSGCSSSDSGTVTVADLHKGGLVWENYTKTDAGGDGTVPSTSKDFVRCKACHGWDGKGLDGGYVRRSAKLDPTDIANGDGRPNPTAGIGNISAQAEAGTVKLNEVLHNGLAASGIMGRLFSTNDLTMPNYEQTGGLTATQARNVVKFLNSGEKLTTFADFDIQPNPVGYSFKGTTDAISGGTLYVNNCLLCHGADGDSIDFDTVAVGAQGLGWYFAKDGKYSEGFHKAMYGIANTSMTRTATGSLTGQQAADILAYIQSTIAPDYYAGGLVWANYTKTDAGGTGVPAVVTSKDFVRCKACHGWDGKGLAGGYVRRSAKLDPLDIANGDGRPNPITGGDLTVQMAAGTVVAADVEHAAGRAFSLHDLTMPNYTATGGLTAKQVADAVAFLNSGPKVTDHATLDLVADPVAYTFTGTSVANGGTLYTTSCSTCHGTDGKSIDFDSVAAGAQGLGWYFAKDGKYSEGFHKIIYGINNTSMTRKAVGNLTSMNAADILTYIQDDLASGTTF